MKRISVLTLLLVVGVLFDSSPAFSGDVIYACVKINQGQMRVVQANEPCGPAEIKVWWNVEGPQGPQGLKGDRGEPGQPGDAGQDLAANLIGTWVGLRINPTNLAGALEEIPVSFTFMADGTFAATDFTASAGAYRVVGRSVLVGPAALHDVEIQGDTLTFGTSNLYRNYPADPALPPLPPGGGGIITTGLGAVYVLARQ